MRIVLGGAAIHARCFVRRASCGVRRAACGVRRPASGVRRAMKHAGFNEACGIARPSAASMRMRCRANMGRRTFRMT
ncbi:hypothetical protein F9946_11785 [Burkholderia thailandensis]|nr:hypothetical protein [Burkholderia thailandensis]MDD1492761.1 hypothetical protein [Burkholderia thailandensis]